MTVTNTGLKWKEWSNESKELNHLFASPEKYRSAVSRDQSSPCLIHVTSSVSSHAVNKRHCLLINPGPSRVKLHAERSGLRCWPGFFFCFLHSLCQGCFYLLGLFSIWSRSFSSPRRRLWSSTQYPLCHLLKSSRLWRFSWTRRCFLPQNASGLILLIDSLTPISSPSFISFPLVSDEAAGELSKSSPRPSKQTCTSPFSKVRVSDHFGLVLSFQTTLQRQRRWIISMFLFFFIIPRANR